MAEAEISLADSIAYVSRRLARERARVAGTGENGGPRQARTASECRRYGGLGRKVAAVLYRYYPAKRGTTTIRDFDGDLAMVLDRSSQISSAIYWSGHHSLPLILFLRDFLRPGMTLVDVGANIGEITLFAAKQLQGGKCWRSSRCRGCLRSFRRTWR